MARGKSSRGSAHVSTPSLTSLLSPSKTTSAYRQSLFTPQIQSFIQQEADYVRQHVDNRRFRPGLPSPGPTKRAFSRLILHPVRGSSVTVGDRLPAGVAFSVPKKVAVCVRRKIRREVLHALQLHHRAGRGGAPRRRNAFSGIKC